jgi:spore coat polysaccharide biosynthesis protein SpsF (cytidylyltransferase family)
MIALIIQARMGSTRLPGKVLRSLAGAPMLAREIERVRASTLVDTIVIATTDKPEDDTVAQLASTLGVHCYRGSEQDVLDRYYHAAKGTGADIVVRITGDCPLQDPVVIDEVIQHFLDHSEIDYVGTPTNYPEGLDTEVFRFSTLEDAWKNAQLPSEREHVTPYIKNHPEKYTTVSWTKDTEDNSSMHWSVDTEEDFQFVEKIFDALYEEGKAFHKDDVLACLAAHPELLAINKGGTGYEGYAKSLTEDEEFLKNKS